MIAGDESLIVRRNGKIARVGKVDSTEGVFIPHDKRMTTIDRNSMLFAGVAAVFIGLMLTVYLSDQNETWVKTSCNYSSCEISNINGDDADINLVLTWNNISMPANIRTSAINAPYICKITTGACYASAYKNGRIIPNPKLALYAIYVYSPSSILCAGIITIVAAAAILYPTAYVIIHGMILIHHMEIANLSAINKK